MPIRTPSLYSQDDPITEALKPPPSETEAQRQIRLQEEAEAKRISEQIDEDLRQEREILKRRRGEVKLLLLGQAESGKSTLQKQFQLMYRPHSLDQERVSWKTVIFFNVVRSIKHILTTLESWEDAMNETQPEAKFGVPGSSSAGMSSPRSASPYRALSPVSSKASTSALRIRLLPLVGMDAALADRLSGGVTVSGSGKGSVFVRTGWQSRTLENAFGRKRQQHIDNGKAPEVVQDPLTQDVNHMLEASSEDIKDLWEHPTVRGLITARRLKLDEWSEFFLRNISRISAIEYIPTTGKTAHIADLTNEDDILHARIQTMGVAEHIFDVNIHGKTVSWHLYDVGGARGQRHTWVPYFDDANAIIFVAPVSAFDQYLEEDPRTNRIDDSLQLFTQICSNPLLKNVHLVLFLNKTDLLKAKLDNGLRVAKYITSFGNRKNDYETVVQYFRAHFLQVHRRNNENRRVLYTHFTSVVDTKATQRIIGNVRDSIFRGYLQSAALV